MFHPKTLLLAWFQLFLSGCNIPQWDCSVVKSNVALAPHNGKSVVLIMGIKHLERSSLHSLSLEHAVQEREKKTWGVCCSGRMKGNESKSQRGEQRGERVKDCNKSSEIQWKKWMKWTEREKDCGKREEKRGGKEQQDERLKILR